MDSAFWDFSVSTPQTLDGTAKLVPGDPFPADGARASRALRVQQLSFLGNGFPLGIIPSYGPASQKELGSLSLQSLLFKATTSNWWLGLYGQFRPKKLIYGLKAEVAGGDELELPAFKDIAKHFLDKSLYSLGLCTQLALTPMSSILFSTEGHGERKGRRSRAMLFHKARLASGIDELPLAALCKDFEPIDSYGLPNHDITMEAAWPELFIEQNGGYWNVPESISLDVSSLISESGLRYRYGLHKNSGTPQAHFSTKGDPPLALMPGLCAKAGFSYEKCWDIWRQRETRNDTIVETDKGRYFRPSYDIRLKEPHASVSGIIGGSCTAWFGGRDCLVDANLAAQSGEGEVNPQRRSPFTADAFGSVCYTLQHGKFRKLYGDLTRVDARLDICSGSAFASGLAHLVSNIFGRSQAKGEVNPLASPRLNLILQQQVAGPIVLRVDSKFSLGSSSGKHGPHVEDIRYSLNYSLRLLRSGKVVAWYSPKRKEGMIELRLFEF
ncbi:hypothetical protein Sjap_004723 [Stephania japonica]|uniref:Protein TRIGALACTOSYLDIACYLGLYCEROL 4, chloroplastic n=1 Tax=Stephania japonica TaxID=461633 RepID=A0AAP0PKH5_9MAGN